MVTIKDGVTYGEDGKILATYAEHCRWAIGPLGTQEQWEFAERATHFSVPEIARNIKRGDIVTTASFGLHGTALGVREAHGSVYVLFQWGESKFTDPGTNVRVVKASTTEEKPTG